MKISLLAPFNGGEEWSVPISFKNHFLKLGYDINVYNTLKNDSFNNESVIKMIDDYQKNKFIPDIVFHLDFGFLRSDKLKKSSIPTAKWVVESGDDPQNFNLNFPKMLTGEFDIVLSPDIRAVKKYKENNINAVWCPYFADPDQYDIDQEPIYDAVTTRSIEEPFFNDLKNKLGCRFEPRVNFLHGKEHSRHLLKGYIVVQNSKYGEITRRIFEGMMARRLVITDRPDLGTEINKIFKEGEDIIYFDDLEDCVDKINYYSERPIERDIIAKNGYEKVIKNHTTEERIKKILSILK